MLKEKRYISLRRKNFHLKQLLHIDLVPVPIILDGCEPLDFPRSVRSDMNLLAQDYERVQKGFDFVVFFVAASSVPKDIKGYESGAYKNTDSDAHTKTDVPFCMGMEGWW